MDRRLLLAWFLSVATAAPLAWAQPAPDRARPDPQDAGVSVPRVIYRSSLATYRALSDEKPASWKETNDNVGRVGGWRAYAKEAQRAKPARDSTPLNADRPSPAAGAKPMHSGQGGHPSN